MVNTRTKVFQDTNLYDLGNQIAEFLNQSPRVLLLLKQVKPTDDGSGNQVYTVLFVYE